MKKQPYPHKDPTDPRVIYQEEWKEFREDPKLSSFSQAELETQKQEARFEANAFDDPGTAPRLENKVRRFFGVSHASENRSDEELRGEILQRLVTEARWNLSQVNIEVLHGDVTLTGKVSTYLEKRSIEDCVQTVLGVRTTENHLVAEHTSA